jgi:hypothetical protein
MIGVLILPVFAGLKHEMILAVPFAEQKQINALHVLQPCPEAQSNRHTGGHCPDRITEFIQ